MLVKLKAPEGVCCASHEGEQFDVAEDGTISVEDHKARHLAHFRALGFADAGEAEVTEESHKGGEGGEEASGGAEIGPTGAPDESPAATEEATEQGASPAGRKAAGKRR